MSESVLLIHGDAATRRLTEQACERIDVSLIAADDIEHITKALQETTPNLVLLDVEHHGNNISSAFDAFRQQWPKLSAILIANRTQSEQAIGAMKNGAIDCLLKPVEVDELAGRIKNALRISRDMTVPIVYESADDDNQPVARMIGQSPAMHEVFKLIGLVAPRDVNVLITGESGTGKELVAKAIYHHSQRKSQPFVAVNCAAIPETLLESELFGHEKGAFTGADVRRIGKFEQCDGGTLFFDEIGDMPLATQAKLLRVLQDGTFQSLGGTKTIRCDVRIIAATHQPLEQMVQRRTFRQDLFYRINVASIHLPPLREREVDAVLLAHNFVKRLNPQMGTDIVRFAPETLPALLSYPWPGNVRELENVIKAALVVAKGNVFLPEFLPDRVRNVPRHVPQVTPATTSATAPATPPVTSPISKPERHPDTLTAMCDQWLSDDRQHGQLHKAAVTEAERAVIAACLEHTNGQLAPAARLLGITRTTLRKKMAELGIHIATTIT